MNPLLLLLPILGLGAYALVSTQKAVAQKPDEKKADKKKSKSDDDKASKRRYSQRLLSYVNKGGSKKSIIKYYQRRIGAKTTGKPDSQTEKKIEQILGYNVSWKPKKKVVKPKVYTSAKKPTVTAPKSKKVSSVRESGPLEQLLATLTSSPKKASSKTTAKAAPVKKPQTATPKLLPATTTRAPQFTSIPAAVPDSVIAATALDSYLRSGGLNRARVKDYQRRLGGLAIDGIPGPKTKARVETLLHRSVSWPAQNAAEDLRKYYRGGGRNRTKIKAFQNAMGELTVDGLVGAKTKKRYKALLGKTW
jgi:hypothetical protein